jgi:hypothetical protein
MGIHKGRSKAQKAHTTEIVHFSKENKAGESASLVQIHSQGGLGVEMAASSVSTTELISKLTETVELQEAELEIVELELKFAKLALVSLEAKLDSSQEQVEKLKFAFCQQSFYQIHLKWSCNNFLTLN